jgi:hypothetical protein
MSRPASHPGLLEAVRSVVPERIRKRLEGGNPAEGWTWAASAVNTTVTTDNGETVTVAPRDGGVTAADVTCSCLLSPKCLHVLAVATALAAASPAAPAAGAKPAPPPEPPPRPVSPPVTLDAGQRGAVAATVRAARALLEAGATGAGPTAVDDLARAVHACRATALHRPARAGLRVLTGLSELRTGKPQFSLSTLTADLRELLWTAEVLARGAGRESDVGIGRRSYSPAGTLRLYGVACEPVAASTGYGGVSTLLVDAQGALYTVSDVKPGGAARAKAACEAPAQLGGATLSHRELSRHGLFVQNATRSADGRLGMGEGVRAVRAGRTTFAEEALARRFLVPATAQLAAAEDGGWLFLVVTLAGAQGSALIAAVDGLPSPVRLVSPTDHKEFAYLENLRLLARAPGLRLRLVARPVGRRTLTVLAVGPAEGEDRMSLPEDWGGRVSLGYDQLRSSHVRELAPREVEVEVVSEEAPDPLAPLRRRVERLVLGGRSTLPGAAAALVEREQAAMARLQLHGGATLAGALFRSARVPGPEVLCVEWLRAATWLDAAGAAVTVADWGA